MQHLTPRTPFLGAVAASLILTLPCPHGHNSEATTSSTASPVPGRAPACLPHLSASSEILHARYPEERGSTRVMVYILSGSWQGCRPAALYPGEGKVEHPGLMCGLLPLSRCTSAVDRLFFLGAVALRPLQRGMELLTRLECLESYKRRGS